MNPSTPPNSPPTTSTEWSHLGWAWKGIWLPPVEGPGTQVVVALHGFGRPLEEMLAYRPLYPTTTAFLSVGLMHHNGSHVTSNLLPTTPLPVHVFQDALDDWVASQAGGRPMPKHLLAYSLGGRVAMALLEHAPSSWAGATLLAPDGFKKNPLYRVAVETRFGAALWRWSNRHIDGVRAAIRGLRTARLLPSHLAHFALHHTEDTAMRTLVANTWMTHREFWPTKGGLRRAWNHPSAGRFVAVFGDRDRIIRWSWSRTWRTALPPHVHFVQVPSGHVMRHPETVEHLRRVILHVATTVSTS